MLEQKENGRWRVDLGQERLLRSKGAVFGVQVGIKALHAKNLKVWGPRYLMAAMAYSGYMSSA